eukprot:XP_015581557.1 keratin, type I cytoskeletal 10 [Ricinus communis]
MQNIHRVISRFPTANGVRFVTEKSKPSFGNDTRGLNSVIGAYHVISTRGFSAKSGGDGENEGKDDWGGVVGGSFGGSGHEVKDDGGSVVGGSFGGNGSDDLGWDSASSWSTGMTKDHFDGQLVGQQTDSSSIVGGRLNASETALVSSLQEIDDKIRELEAENKKGKAFVDGWGEKMRAMSVLLKQVREPGARGSYLKDSEKAEMYRLHKENPEVYTVERLAKDYRIMRQRVHAILWLKELEEEEEKKLGHPLDDSVELLLDTCPEFFNSHDQEFHIASLPYKPDFKVMPEGWDGTIKDLDEVHYEISMKEDDMLYEEFVQKMNFNKMKVSPTCI